MGHEGQLEGLTPTNKQNVESCIFQLKHLGVQQALLKRVSAVRIGPGAPLSKASLPTQDEGVRTIRPDPLVLRFALEPSVCAALH